MSETAESPLLDPIVLVMRLAANAYRAPKDKLDPGPARTVEELASDMARDLEAQLKVVRSGLSEGDMATALQEAANLYMRGWAEAREQPGQWPPEGEPGAYIRAVYDALVMLGCRPDQVDTITRLAPHPHHPTHHFADFTWEAGNTALDAGHWPGGLEVNWYCGMAYAWVTGVGEKARPTLSIATGATDPKEVAQRIRALLQVGEAAGKVISRPSSAEDGR